MSTTAANTRRTARVHDTTSLAAAVAADNESDASEPPKKRKHRRKRKKAKKNATRSDDGSDKQDGDFEASTTGSDSDSSNSSRSGSSGSEDAVSNAELAGLLTSKTAPETATKKRKRPSNKSAPTTATAAASASVGGSAQPDKLDPKASKTKTRSKSNPIYHFYEEVARDAQNLEGQKGDKHYKCWHGGRRIITIKKSMRHNIQKLQNHLKSEFPKHYRLYLLLNERDGPPTDEEIELAQGKKTITTEAGAEHQRRIEESQQSIKKAFAKQVEKQAEPWDQQRFMDLLTRWIVSCDQPFDEVDKPEFRELLEYCNRYGDMKIPSRTTVATRIMKLGKETVAETKKMIEELKCSRVSLSLDAWTSSNQFAFLAIVMHYISNGDKLEELLIDFKEIIGPHSGENMGSLVWETMKMYGLEGRVSALMMDNATNNDTLIEELAARHTAAGLPFDGTQARLRCMPHTIHLAALKLLEGIGAVKKDAQKARMTNYQECIAVPLTDDANDDAEQTSDDASDAAAVEEAADLICKAVPKYLYLQLRHIVRSIRASPQRRKDWMRTAKAFVDGLTAEDASDIIQAVDSIPSPSKALMLILDVVTRWCSSHQMIRRALEFRQAIDTYTQQDVNNLRNYRLSDAEWEAIGLVEKWLLLFRRATLEMSATKRPMLSTVHAIFRSLQQDLRTHLAALPSDCEPKLREAILAAHRKLSDYYWKFDESPFYLWASMLDPRIGYDSLLDDCTEEHGMTEADLQLSRDKLQAYFDLHYRKPAESATTESTSSTTKTVQSSSFTDRYAKKARKITNELEEFWKLPSERWDTCDPIAWWVGRRAQFPQLSRMALDILSIPGSAVAVERIFSGGRDTVSLRRASLSPDTIRVLMIAKQVLRQQRHVIELD